jgi:cell division protein FtsI/penicillin-binding protein 2
MQSPSRPSSASSSAVPRSAEAFGGDPLLKERARRIGRWSAVLLGAVGLALLATAGRVIQLKVAPDPRLVAAMERRDGSPIHHVRRPERQPRGVIFDARGQVVAMDVPAHRLFIDPRFVWREAANRLERLERERRRAEARGRPAPEIEVSLDPIGDAVVAAAERIGESPERMLREVMSQIPADLVTLRTGVDETELARLPRYVVLKDRLDDAEVERLRGARIVGVGVEDRPHRVYPFGRIAASVIGLVGAEHSGLGGVEFRKERSLKPTPGTLVRLVDNRNQTIAIPADGYRPGKPGENIQLSIDMVIQEIVERIIDELADTANAGGARCMVVDVETGEIMAMYDRLRSNTGRSPIAKDPGRALHPALGRNRCVTDPYEPGSTFKSFIWAYATKLGKVRPEERLPTPSAGGHVVSDGRSSRVIRDVKYYGPSTWREVLERSMNAGMAIVAMRMSKKEMQEAVSAFGFGTRTNCGVPGESPGQVTSPRDWTMVYTQCSVAMGHEIGVTVAQMLRAFTAFCRDGTMVELSLERLPRDREPQTRRVLPEAVALATRDAMRGVLLEGTGRRANLFAMYEVFGKSGTAQLPKPKGGGYYDDRYVSSFIAGAPFDRPKIAVLVVVDDPDKHRLGHNRYGGGAIAGPAAVRIINETLQYLGVPAKKSIEPDERMRAEPVLPLVASAP